MNIKVNIAIASHLSDAQELLAVGHYTQANREINYAKAILFKYPDTIKEVSDNELDKICRQVDEKISQTKNMEQLLLRQRPQDINEK